jgi:hypothetical protein
MQTVEIFCRNIVSTGSAFGIRTDTGEQAFIPSAVVKASKIQEGETAQATIAPNKHSNETTPWFVIRIDRTNEEQPQPIQYAAVAIAAAKPSPQTIDDRALRIVQNTDQYMTTAEIAADLGTDSTLAHNALLRLFNQGKIAKADVYGSGGQSRPSFCLWAESAQTFLGDDDE